MIPDLLFKSLQHFEFIFVYGMKVIQFDSFVCSCLKNDSLNGLTKKCWSQQQLIYTDCLYCMPGLS